MLVNALACETRQHNHEIVAILLFEASKNFVNYITQHREQIYIVYNVVFIRKLITKLILLVSANWIDIVGN